MRSLEKFFGVKVEIIRELDPLRIEALAERGNIIMNLRGYNPDEYHLYIHQLAVTPIKQSHFGFVGNVQDRIQQLRLTFAVNPKQQRSGTIKFFNYIAEEDTKESVQKVGTETRILYFIPGSYIDKNLGFKNEIITYVRKSMRTDHRKIKISIEAHPTVEFRSRIKKESEYQVTDFDFRLNGNLTLLPAPEEIGR